MSSLTTVVPEEWRALFEGRNVAFAGLPPAPPRVTSRVGKIVGRTAVLLVAAGVAVGAGFGISAASGRWWVGLIVFLIIAWVATLLGIGMVGAIKVERAAAARRRARSLEDPIGKLLPDRGVSRKAYRDPASYAGLFALEPRPALIFDTALFDVVRREKFAASLAPRGHLPEPEVLDTSSVPAGICFFGLMLIFQSMQFWITAFTALRAGAPLVWTSYPGIAMVAVGIYLVLRDPWIRRRLNVPRFFGRETVIGAGWIRDSRGELWTVNDALVLVTLAGGALEIRLIKRTKVVAFYLPVIIGKPGTGRGKPAAGITGLSLRMRAKTLASDAAEGVVAPFGLHVDGREETDMPTAREPLRLLLSSWTYPEPRVDLAMHE
jgi:hypothetical protein